MIISTQKGSYGQWIVTAELNGFFVSKQYFFCLKREAVKQAREEISNGTFARI